MKEVLMRIEFEKTAIDFGYTPVENMFIHTYLSLANADQIKVYLYALSHAYSGSNDELTNENIAFEMGLTEGQVIDAWSFWKETGLVEITDGKYIFKSIRDSYINQMMGMDNKLGQDNKDKKTYEAEEKQEVSKSKMLIEDIEAFISMGRDVQIKLTNKEIELILSQIKNYNLTYDYFGYAFPLASLEVDSKNVAQVVGVIRNWIIDGATNEEELDKLLEKKASQKENRKNKSSKKPKVSKDDRMSAEERRRFIEEKMKNSDFLPRRD